MDNEQQVFLYKNIDYLRGNEGKQSTLKILVDKLLSKFSATVRTKSILLDTTHMGDNQASESDAALANGTFNINGMYDSVSGDIKILSEDLEEQTSVINDVDGRIEDYDDISTKNHYRVALRDGLTPEEAFHGVSRYSRDNARVPFPWTTGENGGFSTATPWLKCHPDYKDFAAEKLMADKESMFYWYKNMIDLRKQYGDILVEGSFAALDFGVEKSVCYSRTSEKGRIVSLNSFSGDITKYECGEGEIINGDGIASFENGVISLEPFGCALILMK
jgi:hypothetical protein